MLSQSEEQCQGLIPAGESTLPAVWVFVWPNNVPPALLLGASMLQFAGRPTPLTDGVSFPSFVASCRGLGGVLENMPGHTDASFNFA